MPLCKDGVFSLAWSQNGAYLFAAHVSNGRASVWDTKHWDYDQWDADCARAVWTTAVPGRPAQGQVLLVVQRESLPPSPVFTNPTAATNNVGDLIIAEAAILPGSPVDQAMSQRQQGLYTAVKALVFQGDEPSCSHEQTTEGLSGGVLLDIRDDVARELLQQDFPSSKAEVRLL